MAITDKEPPVPTELTPLDRAVMEYHCMGRDFIAILDGYVNAFPHAQRYTFFGPGYILLGQEETRVDPFDPESELTEPYWYVVYASIQEGNIYDLFLRLMPYPLDRVGFTRYVKYPERGVRFLSIDKLQRISKHGWRSSKTSNTSTPSTSATTSCADCAAPDQTGEGSRRLQESNNPTAQAD